MQLIKGCWSWLTSWTWFSPTPTSTSMCAPDKLARAALIKLLEGKFVIPGRSLDDGINAMFDANNTSDFKTLFLKMWQSTPKMYVEMIRCLESDLCSYFGVDPSFKRLCFKIGHHLDDSIYDFFTFPDEDAAFIKGKTLARVVWIIIGLWVLDGEKGLARFAKVLVENEYGGAIECIRRERCRNLFGVPRIPEYSVTEDGFVLSRSLPDMPRRRSEPPRLTPSSSQRETEVESLSISIPSLHSSLLSGLPKQ